ncbi:hypothetical protein VE00_05216 [Pseudogymnoascus sp. WSF 3629]|nr:hypothetical protein VE00_05216 [Pseudogymnoascus sp. WSF 3629]
MPVETRSSDIRPFVDETEDIEHEYDGPDEASIQRESSRGATIDSTPETEYNRPSVTEEGHTGTSRAQNDHHTVSVGDSLSQSDSEERICRRTSSSQTRQYLHPHPPPIPNPPTYTAGNNISVIPLQKATNEYFRNILPRKVLSWPVNDHVKARLLSAYFQSASRWCEVTDSLKTFSTLSSHLIIESTAFEAAAAALSSIMVMKGDEFSVLLADELYSFARSALRGFKSAHRDGGLLGATLLCMYGSASGKTREGQSTLLECAELLQDRGLQIAPRGVLTVCFWVFARQDIWASFLSGRPTLIPTEIWELARPGPNVPIQDSYSNFAILIVARIVNELSKRPADMNLNTLLDLWAELETWVVERPQSVRCVMEFESSGDSPFPTILFSNPSAAAIPNSGLAILTINYGVGPSTTFLLEIVPDSDPSLISYSTTFFVKAAAAASTTTNSPTPTSSQSHNSDSTTAGAPKANTTTTSSPLPSQSSAPSSKGLSAGAAAGIGVGATLGVLILLAIAGFFWRRGRKRSFGPETSAPESALPLETEESQSKKRASELEGTGKIPAELEETSRAELEETPRAELA